MSTRKAVIPPREPRSGSVTAIRMIQSARPAPETQIFLTVDHPLVAVFHGAGPHGRGVGSGLRLGDGDVRERLALGVGLHVALLLVLVAGHHQHVEVR